MTIKYLFTIEYAEDDLNIVNNYHFYAQAEAAKLRNELEARNSIISAENEKFKSANERLEQQSQLAQADLSNQIEVCKGLRLELEKECSENVRARLLVKELVSNDSVSNSLSWLEAFNSMASG